MQNVPKTLSTEQVKDILKEARQHSTRDWCLLLLTFRHALRSQEARTLKLADIDLENCTIAIRLFAKVVIGTLETGRPALKEKSIGQTRIEA